MAVLLVNESKGKQLIMLLIYTYEDSYRRGKKSKQYYKIISYLLLKSYTYHFKYSEYNLKTR